MHFLSLLCALRLSLLTAELNFSKHLPLQQIVAEKGDCITAMKAQQAVGRLKREEALLSNYVSKTKALERCVYSLNYIHSSACAIIPALLNASCVFRST